MDDDDIDVDGDMDVDDDYIKVDGDGDADDDLNVYDDDDDGDMDVDDNYIKVDDDDIDVDDDDNDIKVWERSFLVTHAEGFVSKGKLQLVRADWKLTHSWYTGGRSKNCGKSFGKQICFKLYMMII